MTPLRAEDEIRDIAERSAARLFRVTRDLAAARIASDGAGYLAAMAEARDLFTGLLWMADVLGRRRMALRARYAEEPAPDHRDALAAYVTAQLGGTPALLPAVDAIDAIDDIVSRTPEIAVGFEEVQNVYATKHAFAMARSLDVAVTERVRRAIEDDVAGKRQDTARIIAEIGDWSRAYADTVYQTAVTHAYSAGMWSHLASPEVARVLPGAKFISALLPTTRPNHAACHGLIAPTNSRVWDVYSPPLGYRCLCGLREISNAEARREGLLQPDGTILTLLPPNFGTVARPDPGFGRGRPDRVALFGEIGVLR